MRGERFNGAGTALTLGPSFFLAQSGGGLLPGFARPGGRLDALLALRVVRGLQPRK